MCVSPHRMCVSLDFVFPQNPSWIIKSLWPRRDMHMEPTSILTRRYLYFYIFFIRSTCLYNCIGNWLNKSRWSIKPQTLERILIASTPGPGINYQHQDRVSTINGINGIILDSKTKLQASWNIQNIKSVNNLKIRNISIF